MTKISRYLFNNICYFQLNVRISHEGNISVEIKVEQKPFEEGRRQNALYFGPAESVFLFCNFKMKNFDFLGKQSINGWEKQGCSNIMMF